MRISIHSQLIFLLIIGLILSGCATLDKSECQTVNWESIGFEDGTRGYEASRIGKHRSACAKHHISPDLALYTNGRERGLEQYCRASVGYHTGLSGKSYKNVCPNASEQEFLSGYRYGQRIYKLKSQERHLRNDIKKEEKLLDELAATISDTEAELIRAGVTRKRRAILLDELKHLSERIHNSEAAIAELYDHIDQVTHQQRRLQQNNPYQR